MTNSRWIVWVSLTNLLGLHLKSFFFLSGFSFTDIDNLQDSREREGTIFYFTLPLPPTHEHSDVYLQLCMWDDYHIFSIAPLVFTRLLLDENYLKSFGHTLTKKEIVSSLSMITCVILNLLRSLIHTFIGFITSASYACFQERMTLHKKLSFQ